MGRRRPYFLTGAILSSLALVAMPNSSALWMAAGLLWIMDASINISMEPFRAFVADMLPEEQRTTGLRHAEPVHRTGREYRVRAALDADQSVSCGRWERSAGHAIPLPVRMAFYIGAPVFLGAVLWTIFTTKEYPPEDYGRVSPHEGREQGAGP